MTSKLVFELIIFFLVYRFFKCVIKTTTKKISGTQSLLDELTDCGPVQIQDLSWRLVFHECLG